MINRRSEWINEFKVFNYDTPCVICLENIENKTIYSCGHWVCAECHNKLKNQLICVQCKQQTSKDWSKTYDKSLIEWVPENLWKIFSKLHVRLNRFSRELFDENRTYKLYRYTMLLLKEYYRWLIILSEDTDVLGEHNIPGEIIGYVWTFHIQDTEDYGETCDLIAGWFLHHSCRDNHYYDRQRSVRAIHESYTKKFGEYESLLIEMLWSAERVQFPMKLWDNVKEMFYVKTLTGLTLSLPYDPEMKIGDLKKRLQLMKQGHADQMGLIFAGKSLYCDSAKLSDYPFNVKPNSTVHLVINLRGD